MEGIIIPRNKIVEVESYTTSSSIIEVFYDDNGQPFIDGKLKEYLVDKGCSWLSAITPEAITINNNPFNK